MVKKLFRLSKNPIVHWWWRLDRTLVLLIFIIMLCGGIAISLASGGVAHTYGVDTYYFALRQTTFLLISIPIMALLSLFSVKGVRNFGIIIFILSMLGLLATIFVGEDVKGARRWIYLFGLSIQPTEFLKPAFVLMTAALLSVQDELNRRRNFIISMVVFGVMSLLLWMQPDFGMFVIMGMVWFTQSFLAGIPMWWVAGLVLVGVVTVVGGYKLLPHVQSRLERFFDPTAGDSYQVDRAQEALFSGGLIGRGAGEGVIKHSLPDAHTDFIFAVVAEELGLISCLVILVVYGAIILYTFREILDRQDRFALLAGLGLLILLSLQILINVGVVLNLLPTTGMTLPFISYGGSST